MCLHNYYCVRLLLSCYVAIFNMQLHLIRDGACSCQQPTHIPASEKEEKEASVRHVLSIEGHALKFSPSLLLPSYWAELGHMANQLEGSLRKRSLFWVVSHVSH